MCFIIVDRVLTTVLWGVGASFPHFADEEAKLQLQGLRDTPSVTQTLMQELDLRGHLSPLAPNPFFFWFFILEPQVGFGLKTRVASPS